MNNTDRSRIYAAVGTLLIALLILLWLVNGNLDLSHITTDKPGITLAEAEPEEFVEVIEEELPKPLNGQESAPAENPEPEDNNATPAPESGTDLSDNGPKGPAPKPVTSTKSAPVQETKPKQPTKEEIAAMEKRSRKRRHGAKPHSRLPMPLPMPPERTTPTTKARLPTATPVNLPAPIQMPRAWECAVAAAANGACPQVPRW